MADTVRTRAAILALLADNVSQDISPQDLRDAIISIFGVYGFIYVTGGSVAQTGVGTSPEILTAMDTDGPGQGMTPTVTTDRIVVDNDGTYGFLFGCTFTGSINARFSFDVRKNGSTDLPFGCSAQLDASGNAVSVFCGGIATGIVATDWFDVYMYANASGKNITPVEAGLIAFRFF